MKFNIAVILAAGSGTRMRPITNYVPKALVEVENMTLVEHVINFLKKNEIKDIFVTYGYKGNLLIEKIHKQVSGLINTENEDNAYFLFNSPIKDINEPIIVCPCDMIADIDFDILYEEYESIGSPPACIVPVKTSLDADSISTDGTLITSISRGEKTKIYASGIQILNPKIINESIEKYDNFYGVWGALIEKKMLHCTFLMPNFWKVFDKPEDIVK